MGIASTLGKGLMAIGEAGLKTLEPVAEKMGAPIASKSLMKNLEESASVAGASLATEWKRIGTSGRSFLMKNGPSSIKQAQLMDAVEEESRLEAGRMTERLDAAIHQAFGGKHTLQDMYHIADVIEGTVPAKSQAHIDVATAWEQMMDEYAEQALDVNLQELQGGVYHTVYNRLKNTPVQMPDGTSRPRTHGEAASAASKAARRPFQPRDLYLPHYWNEESINKFLDSPAEVEKAMQVVMKQGLTNSREEAMHIVRAIARQPSEFRGGPLQHSREMDQFITGGYEKDIRKVGARYFYTASRRLKAAQAFGAKDEVFTKDILPRIAAEGGNAQIANNLYLAFSNSTDPKFKEAFRLASTLHSITMLSTAGIVQPSQLANVVARANWTDFLKGTMKVAGNWKKSLQEAEHMGAVIDSVRAEYAGISEVSDLSRFWLKFIGLEQLDRMNRVIAAHTGRFHAQSLASKLAKGGMNKESRLILASKLRRHYGIDEATVMAQGGALTKEQLQRSGFRLAKDTQFATTVLDMPEFRNTPFGQFMFLFKSFAFQQSRFIKDNVIKEYYLHGNLAPFANYVMAIAGVSEVLAPVIRAAKGRKKPDDPVAQVMEDAATIGSMGMAWDAVRAIHNGPDSVVNWVIGPTLSEAKQFVTSDIAGVGRGILREGRPDFDPMLKHAVRRTPLIGPHLYHAWWGEP